MNKFTILKESKFGRLGRIDCKHGSIETPAFIFCATKGAIKGASIETMKQLGTQVILSNTYNLMDFPGGDFIEDSSGLHSMMNWDGPMFTDSGGFQVFSLGYGSVSDEIKGKRSSVGFKVKINDEGITFHSPRSGARQLLTPERSIQIQKQIGADFIFVLDECTPSHMTKEQVAICMRRSHSWEKRSYEEHRRLGSEQGLYGIVQGGVHEDLRRESIDFVNSMDFFGHGIGGSLGKSKDEMCEILSLCDLHLSKDRPKHLLGIGKMDDIRIGATYGIDTFDCVHPTRIARHGGALVSEEEWVQGGFGYKEHISITNAKYKKDYSPLDNRCDCVVCKSYTRSYIHYLFMAKEMLGILLLVQHNVRMMNKYMEELRDKIRSA